MSITKAGIKKILQQCHRRCHEIRLPRLNKMYLVLVYKKVKPFFYTGLTTAIFNLNIFTF